MGIISMAIYRHKGGKVMLSEIKARGGNDFPWNSARSTTDTISKQAMGFYTHAVFSKAD